MRTPIYVVALTIASMAAGEVLPPCGDSYGSSADRTAIENALYSGTIEQARAAIEAAKATRGAAVGCPDTVFPRVTPDDTPPALDDALALWNDVHAPGLATYAPGACAPLGRDWPAAGLGGFYARLAGQEVDDDALRALATDLVDTQYGAETAAQPLITYPGLYAYTHTMAESSSPCYRPGVIADGIDLWCGSVSAYCPEYTAGTWAGDSFLVVDFSTSPRAYDGGAAYDHGWAAQFMIEAWFQETDPVLRARLEASVRLAGAWCRDEPAVRNHNYTAKLIWALAELYAATGEAEWKVALLDKLERSLKPGVLMDLDNDGNVDGMNAQPFTALTPIAQTPGRMWDGHNSIAWYQSMNTWAMLEAYIAFRDRGDTAEAAELRPYAVAMLDNLALELNTFGTVTQADVGAGIHPLPVSLALGIWKLARHENDPHPEWEAALWGLYNTGYFNTFQAGRSTASLGLILLLLTNSP